MFNETKLMNERNFFITVETFIKLAVTSVIHSHPLVAGPIKEFPLLKQQQPII